MIFYRILKDKFGLEVDLTNLKLDWLRERAKRPHEDQLE